MTTYYLLVVSILKLFGLPANILSPCPLIFHYPPPALGFVASAASYYRDLTLRGFDLGRWLDSNSKAQAQDMLNEVVSLVQSGKLQIAYVWNTAVG